MIKAKKHFMGEKLWDGLILNKLKTDVTAEQHTPFCFRKLEKDRSVI
jgi:hypothetical protein